MKQINIAVIGLGFGASFAEIYTYHPNVDKVYVVDTNPQRIDMFMKRVQHKENLMVLDSFEAVLQNDRIDAVHVCTGIPDHARHAVAVMNAGKHCACAVPMADSLEDIQAVVEAARRNDKKYMMMETSLFGSAYFTAKEMRDAGEFGIVQHMRGIHYQPMDDGYWKNISYWHGLPPMHYATHAISPLHGIAGSRIEKVVCFGGGQMDEALKKNYNNPYPIEDALLSFENGLTAQVVRGLFACSAKSTESFNIYGSKKTFMDEYTCEIIEKVYDEAFYDSARFDIDYIQRKNYYNRLPEELQRFTVKLSDVQIPNWKEHIDTAPLCVHDGSHPHLCHEFVSCIVDDRKSVVNEEVAANITAAGLCAHQSALRGGEVVQVPKF